METKQCRSEISNVEEEKDLGILIDQKLTFESHITSKINIANRNLGIIRRTFTYLDKEIFLHLYKSLVRPHLEFASSVWSPHLKKTQDYSRERSKKSNQNTACHWPSLIRRKINIFRITIIRIQKTTSRYDTSLQDSSQP